MPPRSQPLVFILFFLCYTFKPLPRKSLKARSALHCCLPELQCGFPLFDYEESSMAALALASSHILPICGHCGFCPITLLKSFLKGHLFIRSTACLSVLSLSSAAFSTVYFLLQGHHLHLIALNIPCFSALWVWGALSECTP